MGTARRPGQPPTQAGNRTLATFCYRDNARPPANAREKQAAGQLSRREAGNAETAFGVLNVRSTQSKEARPPTYWGTDGRATAALGNRLGRLSAAASAERKPRALPRQRASGEPGQVAVWTERLASSTTIRTVATERRQRKGGRYKATADKGTRRRSKAPSWQLRLIPACLPGTLMRPRVSLVGQPGPSARRLELDRRTGPAASAGEQSNAGDVKCRAMLPGHRRSVLSGTGGRATVTKDRKSTKVATAAGL